MQFKFPRCARINPCKDFGSCQYRAIHVKRGPFPSGKKIGQMTFENGRKVLKFMDESERLLQYVVLSRIKAFSRFLVLQLSSQIRL
jgi:hypothetical protein